MCPLKNRRIAMTNGGGHPSDITPQEAVKPADEKKNPPPKPIGGVK
jgi:hypothetical protein